MELLSIVGEIRADGLVKVSRVYGDLHKDVEGFDGGFGHGY